MIQAISDLHLNPGDKFPDLREFVENSRLVLNGDILNILPWGMKEWRSVEGERTIESFVGRIPKQGCDYVIGNHEGRLKWVEELFANWRVPSVRIARSLDIFIGDVTWHFEHGHKMTEWRILRHFADDVTKFAVAVSPELWYKFCKKRGWIISSHIELSPEKYQRAVGTYWGLCMNYAHKNDVNFVVGHSHSAMRFRSQFGIEVVDLGSGKLTFIC